MTVAMEALLVDPHAPIGQRGIAAVIPQPYRIGLPLAWNAVFAGL